MDFLINAIIDVIYLAVAAIVNIFDLISPTVSLPPDMVESLTNAGIFLVPFSFIFDFTVLSQCIFMLMSVSASMVMYKFIRFGLSFIPFKGGS